MERAGDLEQQLALEDVERLLEAVDVRGEPAAGQDGDRREVRVDRALRPARRAAARASPDEVALAGAGWSTNDQSMRPTECMGPAGWLRYSNRRDQASTPTARSRMTPSVTCW